MTKSTEEVGCVKRGHVALFILPNDPETRLRNIMTALFCSSLSLPE